MVSQTPYEIWHGKLMSYKYLRVWGSPAYVKRLVGDKLDSRSMFLEKSFLADSRRDEVLLEETNETPQQNEGTSFEPIVPTDSVPILRRSTMESRLLDREVTSFKARLVAKEYTQQNEVDFEETYSPVDMAIRIQLAIAVWYDYEIWQMDVKMTFSNGSIEEEMYMNQPEGFTSVGEDQKVCRLQSSIYSLKQTSRSRNTHFDEVIRGYDFIKNEFDPCVHKKTKGSAVAYLVLYVDDILLIGNDVEMFGDIKAWLSIKFSMKDKGEASYILGIKIYRDKSRRTLGLTQSSYIEKVLERFKMENPK
ncbi:UNVERIFIED_CONTAM: Retrovirus-related Pol polyprotein from transposon TNT 1-94 [Sesamum indicum]